MNFKNISKSVVHSFNTQAAKMYENIGGHGFELWDSEGKIRNGKWLNKENCNKFKSVVPSFNAAGDWEENGRDLHSRINENLHHYHYLAWFGKFLHIGFRIAGKKKLLPARNCW